MPMNAISINPVTQGHKLGCGIACAAMLANKSYFEAAEIILGAGKAKRTKISELKDYLAQLSIPFESKEANAWRNIKGLAIVGVNEDDSGNWHWVIFINDDKRKILIDPCKDSSMVIYDTKRWINKAEGYWLVKNLDYLSILLEVDAVIL